MSQVSKTPQSSTKSLIIRLVLMLFSTSVILPLLDGKVLSWDKFFFRYLPFWVFAGILYILIMKQIEARKG
jgi:hypothetical protein